MRSALWLMALVLVACSAGQPPVLDAAPSDTGRLCGVPLQLEMTLADRGSCVAPPIVMLVTDGTGAVQSVSGRVPLGVTVPSIACTSGPPTRTATACSWTLSLHCQGRDGERLDLDGTLVGADHTWTSDAITLTLTGLPPARLTCGATSGATTR